MEPQHELVASFVIPAHNEQDNLPATVSELQEALRAAEIPYELVLVNDNSTDDTARVIADLMREDANIRTVNRTPPGGFGRAIRSGIDLVQGDVVIIYMADKSDDPKDAVAYYRKIEEGYDCVFGSRFRKESKVENYPTGKLLANRIVNRCIQVLFWTRFNDLTNAFKAYRTHVVRECGPYRASHFNITIEMSLSALIRRYSVAEVPIAWYGRTWGSSHLHLGQMGRRYLSTLLKVFAEKALVADDVMAEKLSHMAERSHTMTGVERRLSDLERRVTRLEADGETRGE
jgi:dolichol-phosphate mannosyltransferase